MASLANKSPGTTYKDLLTVYDGDDNEGLETDLKSVFDGEGVTSSIQLSTTDLNVHTHNGSSQGLKLNEVLVTASAAEINELKGLDWTDGVDVTDPVTVGSNQTIINKTINGGSW